MPHSLSGTALPFHYNKIEELEALVKKHKDIGVIVVETMRNQAPADNFLGKVRKIADEQHAVLIFDEISSGFRMTIGGLYRNFNVEPDIVAYAKAMSNGYAMGAVVGRSEVMDAAQTSFISSTYWTEGIGPTAALATIAKMEKHNVPQHILSTGNTALDLWEKLGKEAGLKLHIDRAFPPIAHFDFEYENKQAIGTLFTQEMLSRGYLASRGLYCSYAHKKEHLDRYAETCSEVFALLKKAIDEKKVEKSLKGPIAHTGFQRLT